MADLKNFRFQCIACDNVGRKHASELFVNWEKHFYLLTCLTCNISEVFDKEGKKIELKEDTEPKKAEKKEKLVN